MRNRRLYIGNALRKISSNGRVKLPSTFDSTVRNNNSKMEVTICAHSSYQCLMGFDTGTELHIQREHTRLPTGAENLPHDYKQFNCNRVSFGMAKKMVVGMDEYIQIPNYLIEHADVMDYALFVGAGDYFEIWNPILFLDDVNVDAQLKTFVSHLLYAKNIHVSDTSGTAPNVAVIPAMLSQDYGHPSFTPPSLGGSQLTQ